MAAIAAILDFVRQFKRERLSQWRPNVQGRLVSTRRRSLSIFSPVAHPKWPPRQTSWISFLVISNKFKHDLLQNITFLTPVNPSFYGLFYLATHWDQVNLSRFATCYLFQHQPIPDLDFIWPSVIKIEQSLWKHEIQEGPWTHQHLAGLPDLWPTFKVVCEQNNVFPSCRRDIRVSVRGWPKLVFWKYFMKTFDISL